MRDPFKFKKRCQLFFIGWVMPPDAPTVESRSVGSENPSIKNMHARPVASFSFLVENFYAGFLHQICRKIDNASVATLPLGTRGNLTTEAACHRFGSLTGFDD